MTSHSSSTDHVEAQRMNKGHRIENSDAAQKVCHGSSCHRARKAVACSWWL